MDKLLAGLNNITKLVGAIIKVVVIIAIGLFLVDGLFKPLQLNMIDLTFFRALPPKTLTTIILLLLIWIGFKEAGIK